MPQYLSTTQPETLLLLRRLDGYRASGPITRRQQLQQLDGDQRRMWYHRSPNTSQQSLRFEEAQRRVKRVEDFKQAQNTLGRILPLRCWSGRLPMIGCYDEELMTSLVTMKGPVAPTVTNSGTTEALSDAKTTTQSTCCNSISSCLPLQSTSGQIISLRGHSSSTLPVQTTQRHSFERRQVDGDRCHSLMLEAAAAAGVAETGKDAIRIGYSVTGKTLVKPSQIHLQDQLAVNGKFAEES